ncbi:MAG: MBL fold metallo-hydrolase, partial [Catenulispora sp.]
MSDPFTPAAAAGVHRLAIPTPFAVGRVNTYLIEDDPLTLVDSGPNSGRALDELQMRLRDRGHSIDDIGLILVTHQHIDHIGLVDIVAAHSKAEVAAIEQAVPFVENYSQAAAEDDRFAMDLMVRHGIPEEVARALGSVSAAFRGWGAKAKI